MKSAERLREVRKALGLTQSLMAKELNTSVRTYQNYEQGKRSLQLVQFVALAGLGFSVDWLLTGEGQMNRQAETKGGGGVFDEYGIRRVINTVMATLQTDAKKLTPEKIADLVVLAYHDLKESGANEVDEEKIRRYINLAS